MTVALAFLKDELCEKAFFHTTEDSCIYSFTIRAATAYIKTAAWLM